MISLLLLLFFLAILLCGAHAVYLVVWAGTHPLHVLTQILVIVVLVSLSHLIRTRLAKAKAPSSPAKPS